MVLKIRHKLLIKEERYHLFSHALCEMRRDTNPTNLERQKRKTKHRRSKEERKIRTDRKLKALLPSY
jgi:hypothetical protein